MSYTKTIACFANSRKEGGRCVAGKILLPTQTWIRPISNLAHGTISYGQRQLPDGQEPRLLDLLEISFDEPRPDGFQSENHLITEGSAWKKAGTLDPARTTELCDRPASLWINGYSSSNGANDKIPLERATAELQTSLLLVELTDSSIRVQMEGGYFSHPKKKTRLEFSYNDTFHRLAVTDPEIEAIYRVKPEGSYPLGRIVLCASLALFESDGNCYKFAAGIIQS